MPWRINVVHTLHYDSARVCLDKASHSLVACDLFCRLSAAILCAVLMSSQLLEEPLDDSLDLKQ